MRRVFIITVLVAGTLFACLESVPVSGLQPNEDFESFVDSRAQRGLLFWDNNRQELVIQPGYSVNTLDVGEDEYTEEGNLKDFTSFAWLIPLPSLPDSYTEVDADLFDDIDKFTEVESRLPASSDARDREDDGAIVGGREDDSLEFLETLDVGDYSVQPIKTNGEEGAKELKAWIKDNDFKALDDRVLRYYVEENFYWLAVKLESKDGLPAEAQLKPLHISFRSGYPVYPYKIFDKQGELDLELWAITRSAVDLVKSKRFGIKTPEQNDEQTTQRNREPAYIELPKTVRAIADGHDDLKNLRIGKVFVYRFSARRLEVEGGFDLGLLQDELHFEFKDKSAKKPEKEVMPLPEEDDEGKSEEPAED